MESNYNIIRIQQYLQGQMSREEMHALEREAMDDPFLEDAIEGYRLQADVNHGRLSLLQQRLSKRIEGQQQERNRFYFTSQRLGIAATAAVLFILVLLLFWMKSDMFSAATSNEQIKEVQVETSVFGELPTRLVITSAPSADGNRMIAATPVGGWSALGEHIQSNFDWGKLFAVTAVGDKYNITFEIGDTWKPSHLVVTAVGGEDGEGGEVGEDMPVNERLVAEFARVLEAGPVWRGKEGAFELEFRP